MKDLSHWQLRKTLAAAAEDDHQQPPHARAFAAWVQLESLGQAALLGALADEATKAQGAARETSHVAVLGYAASLDDRFVTPFADGLAWLRARQYFVQGRPLTFEIDGLALLGVATGLSKLDAATSAAASAWLDSVLAKSISRSRKPDWNESLIQAALAVRRQPGGAWSGSMVADDLVVALSAKGLANASEAVRANAWTIISSLMGESDGMGRAATQLAALTTLLRDASTLRPGATSIADVARLLAGVARSMRRWAWDEKPLSKNSVAAHWDIDNEYHVQDMLWAILAPLFPDLDDEEWLKSLGQHHPRADLAIPSLELIIEVKYLRKGGKAVFVDVIKEVAADASTYLQKGSGYKHIVAFIWDDEARTEEHPELLQGLTRLRGVEDAIVISRPARMTRSDRDEPKAT
ncbi:hypothetical protein DFLDMN_000222 [Cupriavidus sp. H19C3]|uniref:PD-(D/E)XK nuclease domain-containing protein n=1 Tax=Cupriavidus sp. H19C3 TaxID=3241603 RepID=UPI003BF88737